MEGRSSLNICHAFSSSHKISCACAHKECSSLFLVRPMRFAGDELPDLKEARRRLDKLSPEILRELQDGENLAQEAWDEHMRSERQPCEEASTASEELPGLVGIEDVSSLSGAAMHLVGNEDNVIFMVDNTFEDKEMEMLPPTVPCSPSEVLDDQKDVSHSAERSLPQVLHDDDDFPQTAMYISDVDERTEDEQKLLGWAELVKDVPPEQKKRRKRGKCSDSNGLPSISLKGFAKKRGLTPSGAKWLLACGMPISFLNLLVFLESVFKVGNNDGEQEPVEFIEYFSGAARIHSRFTEAKVSSLKFDEVESKEFEDMLSESGFLTALAFAKRLVAFGVGHYGTCCKSWIFTSRGSTLRDELCILGDQTRKCVIQGNRLAAKTVLLIIFHVAMGAGFCLEQPNSSLLGRSPWMRLLNSLRAWTSTFTWMGAFGHDIPKPTSLFHFCAPLADRFPEGLARTLTREQLTAFDSPAVDYLPPLPGSDRIRYSGTADLETIQIYTKDYANQFYLKWKEAQTARLNRVAKGEDVRPWVETAFPTEDDEMCDWKLWARKRTEAKQSFGVDWEADCFLRDVCKLFSIPCDTLL